jgi:hypothetical protein
MSARLGWLTHHPDSEGRIAGRVLPDWSAVRDLSERAHLAFCGRILVG